MARPWGCRDYTHATRSRRRVLWLVGRFSPELLSVFSVDVFSRLCGGVMKWVKSVRDVIVSSASRLGSLVPSAQNHCMPAHVFGSVRRYDATWGRPNVNRRRQGARTCKVLIPHGVPRTQNYRRQGETKTTICGELVNYPENPRLCREVKTLQNQETRK